MIGFDKQRFMEDFKRLKGTLSDEELASRLDIRRSYISMLESGKQIPKVELLTRIANMCGTRPSDYFKEMGDDPAAGKLPYIVVDDTEK